MAGAHVAFSAGREPKDRIDPADRLSSTIALGINWRASSSASCAVPATSVWKSRSRRDRAGSSRSLVILDDQQLAGLLLDLFASSLNDRQRASPGAGERAPRRSHGRRAGAGSVTTAAREPWQAPAVWRSRVRTPSGRMTVKVLPSPARLVRCSVPPREAARARARSTGQGPFRRSDG